MRNKKINKLILVGMMVITSMAVLAGCGGNDASNERSSINDTVVQSADSDESENTDSIDNMDIADSEITEVGNEDDLYSLGTNNLKIHFGDDGDAYTIHLYDNETAQAIAGYAGTSDWRLPIYHYNDFEGYEYFQYYDIPSRYEIPSASEIITTTKAGEIYYSEPNRLILFYEDAEISEEYTPVGYIDYSEDFQQAVEKNPVLEGWGNKIVLISDGE